MFEWLIRFCEGSALPAEMVMSACTLLKSLLMQPEDLQEHASALYRHTCAMFGNKHFSGCLNADDNHQKAISVGDNRAALRCELIQVVVHLYSLFSTNESILKVWEVCPFKSLISLCNLEMCSNSVHSVLHGLSKLIQTQPVFSARFEQHGGWATLRGMLIDPLCANDPCCYRILFACLLGRQLPVEVRLLHRLLLAQVCC